MTISRKKNKTNSQVGLRQQGRSKPAIDRYVIKKTSQWGGAISSDNPKQIYLNKNPLPVVLASAEGESIPAPTPSFMHVTLIDPAHNDVEVALDKVITVTFDEEIDPATVDSDSFQVEEITFGIATGNLAVLGNVVTFTPVPDFFMDGAYTITLNTDIKSVGGQSLQTDYYSTFYAESGGPAI